MLGRDRHGRTLADAGLDFLDQLAEQVAVGGALILAGVGVVDRILVGHHRVDEVGEMRARLLEQKQPLGSGQAALKVLGGLGAESCGHWLPCAFVVACDNILQCATGKG